MCRECVHRRIYRRTCGAESSQKDCSASAQVGGLDVSTYIHTGGRRRRRGGFAGIFSGGGGIYGGGVLGGGGMWMGMEGRWVCVRWGECVGVGGGEWIGRAGGGGGVVGGRIGEEPGIRIGWVGPRKGEWGMVTGK